MSFLYILLAIFMFGVLIFIHELGHFLVARMCGVKILEFAIGMGPKILSHKSRKSGTVYALRLFPIGGFVSMLGENGMEAVQGDNGEEKRTPSVKDLINEENVPAEPEIAEPEPIDPEIAKHAYCNQSVWKRMLISLAGPVMNVILGFLLMVAVVLLGGHGGLGSTRVGGFYIAYTAEESVSGFEPGDHLYSIDGDRMYSYDHLKNTVAASESGVFTVVIERQDPETLISELITLEDVRITDELLGAFTSSLSESAGLKINDEIIKVNNTHVHTYNELSYEIMNQGYRPMTLTVLRGEEELVLENVIVPSYEESGAVFGSVDFIPFREAEFDFATVMKHAWFRSLSTVKTVYDSLFGLISGRYGAETVSGPVGITKTMGEIASNYGLISTLYLIVVISINLGVMNLLPIPAMDGGHLLIYLIELIRRKPLKKEVEGMINFVGLVLILALAVVITVKDVIMLL